MATVARRRSGEGLIRQRADGRWEARIRLGLHRRSIYGRTEQDVRQELTKLLADRDAGRPVIRRTVQVGPWLRRWVESHPVRETSRAQYRYVIERYLVPELGRIRLADLRKIHIEEAFERIADRPKARGDGRISAGTVAAAHRALSAGLSAAVENDLLAYNVARRVHPPRTEREIVPPDPDEIEGMFGALADEELLPLFLLLRWSGCRLGEARGLRWSDVDVRNLQVTFARQVKGPLKERVSRRTLPLPEHVVAALGRMPRRSLSLVFTTRTGRPLDNRRCQRVMERACTTAKIAPPAGSGKRTYTPHDLRHAFAKELLEAGLPDSYVMSLLGHSQVTTTIHTYGHIRPRRGVSRSPLAEFWDPREVTTIDHQIDHHAGRRRA